MIRVIAIILLLLGMSACTSNVDNDFVCPSASNGVCRSVHEVNGYVDSGQLPLQESTVSNTKVTASDSKGPFGNFSTPYPVVVKGGEPIRSGETVVGIWIAPFEDKDNNYHQASEVYTVVHQSQWRGKPVNIKDFIEE